MKCPGEQSPGDRRLLIVSVAPEVNTLLGYPIRVGAGALAELGSTVSSCAPAHTVALITDAHVAAHWLSPAMDALAAGATAPRIVSRAIPAGETEKTRARWAELTDWLLGEGCGRDTTVVALGGGVVGDLAGFVAATYMRGVPIVQVPTTLLSMVDASIGGKTGVDTPAGKNLVGAFHDPAAVLADPMVLATLPARELRAGMAEVLKHGAIADRGYFEQAAAWCADTSQRITRGVAVDWADGTVQGMVARSVAIKAAVVAEDPREAGRRLVLNAGHTVAHALERATDFAVAHGEAVSIGLVAEAVLAERIGVARRGTAAILRKALAGAGLPVSLPQMPPADALLAAMRADKKGRGGRLTFALLASVGESAGDQAKGWGTPVAESDVLEALRAAVLDRE